MARFNFEAAPRALDDNGVAVSDATLEIFEAGTTSPVDTFSDIEMVTAHPQPIPSDDAGYFPQVYLATGSYKVVVKDPLGNTLYEVDNISQSSGASGTDFSSVNDLLTSDTVFEEGMVFNVGGVVFVVDEGGDTLGANNSFVDTRNYTAKTFKYYEGLVSDGGIVGLINGSYYRRKPLMVGDSSSTDDIGVDGWTIVKKLGLPDPFNIASGGQSNTIGSDGGVGGDWITQRGRVFVWSPVTSAFVDAVDMEGVDPFNTDGSNNSTIHAALKLSHEIGSSVQLSFAAEGSTEIEEWTGGGYRDGSPIVADRSINSSNRVQFKKWSDALSINSLTQFDAFVWCQGEADLDTPEEVYLEELDYLVGEVKALGSASVADRLFPVVVCGLYTGEKVGQQGRRSVTLQRYANESEGDVVFTPTDDLLGRDDDPDNIEFKINHYDALAYTQMGKRAASGIMSVLSGQIAGADLRVEDNSLKPSGLFGHRLGHRLHEFATLVGTEVDVTAISQANPCTLTAVGHGKTTGDVVKISDVNGMTEINGLDSVVTVVDVDTITLDTVDSTSFTPYTDGGLLTTSVVMHRALQDMRGELYRVSGSIAFGLDPTLGVTLGDGGLGFDFYTLSASDTVKLFAKSAVKSRSIVEMGVGDVVSGGDGITITGKGHGRVMFRGSRYYVDFTPQDSPDAGYQEISNNAGFTALAGVTFLHLTANFSTVRNGTLPENGYRAGATMDVKHAGSGSSVNILDGESGSTLFTLAVGNSRRVAFDGTNWNAL